MTYRTNDNEPGEARVSSSTPIPNSATASLAGRSTLTSRDFAPHVERKNAWDPRFTATSLDEKGRDSNHRVSSERFGSKGSIDSRLLHEAMDLVDSITPTDATAMVVHVNSLSGILCELWRSAAQSSQHHRNILAAVESAALSAAQCENVTPSQLSALRGALVDLGQPVLTQTNVDSIASRLLDEGFSPMAIVGDVSPSDLSDD